MRSTPSTCGTLLIATLLATGCASGGPAEKDKTFSTSGSRAADQRADQRMAKEQQIKGGEDEGKKKEADDGAVVAPAKKTLFESLGGQDGVAKVIDDFVNRINADPQVNFTRKGVKVGGLSFSRGKSLEWQATPQALATIKKNLTQFLVLKAGGPVKYDGPPFETATDGLHVSNAEFDAATGDMSATLDKLRIADQEKKELLQIMEAVRPQVVEKR